jgi:hypothetical protein
MGFIALVPASDKGDAHHIRREHTLNHPGETSGNSRLPQRMDWRATAINAEGRNTLQAVGEARTFPAE